MLLKSLKEHKQHFGIIFIILMVSFWFSLPPHVLKANYSPNVSKFQTYPGSPVPNVPVTVNGTVFDKFGKIKISMLSFSTDNGTTWHNVGMNLTWGTPSNGNYSAIIPRQVENTTVEYKIYFRDDLNYSHTSGGNYTVQKDKTPPYVDSWIVCGPDLSLQECPGITSPTYLLSQPFQGSVWPDENASVYVDITDDGSGVKNTTLYYTNNQPNYFETIHRSGVYTWGGKLDNVTMTPIQTHGANVIYRAILPRSQPFITSIYFFVVAYDRAGNCGVGVGIMEGKAKSCADFPELHLRHPIKFWGHYDIKPQEVQCYAPVTANFTIMDVNLSKMAAALEINTKVPLDALNEEKALSNELSVSDIIQRGCNLGNFPVYGGPYTLVGDPSSYPFDTYHLDLIVLLQEKNATLQLKANLDNHTKSIWSLSNFSKLGIDNDTVTKVEFNCVYLHNATSNSVYASEVPLLCPDDRSERTFQNLKFDFTRNYTIYAITIPIIAIFYLLGAIFIFESSEVGSRLALTLGIFALIFTLPTVINSMKPLTAGPTIADSLLSIIIIATVVFTISSVIGSREFFKEKFPRLHSWEDTIAFVIISVIVGALLLQPTYISVTIWLVPIILFGLGYGLLLRLARKKLKTDLKQSRQSNL